MQVQKWRDLTTIDFAALDPERTVAVLPIAATEQHGPHLPTGTDGYIAECLLGEFESLANAGSHPGLALVLPVMEVGASLEHSDFSGTLSFSSGQLSDQLVALAGGVAASGLTKMLTISSHGGNVSAMTSAALEARAKYGILNVVTNWNRLGYPPDLISDNERANGIHGGFVETSLMLHFRPDLVRMDALANWPSNQQHLANTHSLLRAHGPIGFGWMAQDLNENGVVGDATSAHAEAGVALAKHQAAALMRLIEEMQNAPLSDLLASQSPA